MTVLKQIAIVGCGGFVGATARMLIADFVKRRAPEHPYVGTLVVNLIGCFLIGLLIGLIPRESPLRPLLLTGFLGSLTTFSTFGLDAVGLMRSQQLASMGVYVGANVLVGCFAVWLGGSLVNFERW